MKRLGVFLGLVVLFCAFTTSEANAQSGCMNEYCTFAQGCEKCSGNGGDGEYCNPDAGQCPQTCTQGVCQSGGGTSASNTDPGYGCGFYYQGTCTCEPWDPGWPNCGSRLEDGVIVRLRELMPRGEPGLPSFARRSLPTTSDPNCGPPIVFAKRELFTL